MKAEIISSGTELLLGEVVDTNTPFLARELAAIGMNVYHHTTVGDNPDRLLEAIQLAERRADVVIVSGGLGPTADDITKDILAKHLSTDLVLDEESFQKANKRFNTNKLSKENYRQALILKGSLPLKNDLGMAAGIFMEKNHRLYILLPGVPREFEHMVKNHLVPMLVEKTANDHILRSRNLNFYGLPEAKVAEKLADLIEHQTNPTLAIYAKEGIIELRLTARGKTEAECAKMLDKVEEKILYRLGDYFFGCGSTRLQDVVFEELALQGKSLSLVEIQTDGEVLDNLAHETARPEAFKGGIYFTEKKDAADFFSDQTFPKETKEANEALAQKTLATFQSDYGVAVTGLGHNKHSYNRMPETVWISVANGQGNLYTEEFNLAGRHYFARWLIALKVSDIIRRVLLKLPQLAEKNEA